MTESSAHWVAWTYWADFQIWDGETLAKIHFEPTFMEELEKILLAFKELIPTVYSEEAAIYDSLTE